jgi:hypothetical protein
MFLRAFAHSLAAPNLIIEADMKEPADKREKPERKCDVCGKPLKFDTRCMQCRWLTDDEGTLPWEK